MPSATPKNKSEVTSKYLKESIGIALYSVVGAIVMTAFTCGACRYSLRLYVLVSLFTTVVWFVMWMGNGMLSEYIGCIISWVQRPVRRLVVGVLSTIAFSVTTVMSLMLLFEYAFDFNFGNYLQIIEYTLIVTFTISLFLHSREFLKNWRLSAINAEKFEKESIKAQYDSLKNQVNPHFLFNSLNALTNLVYEDADKAAKFIKQLSEVYRYLLDTRELELVPLEEELKFLRSYLYLLEIRFGSNLQAVIDLKDDGTSVIPLALQLLAENAVKHNIISRDQPLSIRIYRENDYLVVENNLQKKTEPDETLSGLGLENIRKRYAYMSSKEVIVTEEKGLFIVKLPVLTVAKA